MQNFSQITRMNSSLFLLSLLVLILCAIRPRAHAADYMPLPLQPTASESVEVKGLTGNHLAASCYYQGKAKNSPLELLSTKAFPSGLYRLRLRLIPSHTEDIPAWAGGLRMAFGADRPLTPASWRGIDFIQSNWEEERILDIQHLSDGPITLNLEAYCDAKVLMEAALNRTEVAFEGEMDEGEMELFTELDPSHSFYFLLAGVEILPLSRSACVERVTVDKVLYKPGETLTAGVTLRRFQNPVKGILHLFFEYGLSKREEAMSLAVDFTGEVEVITVKLPLPGRKFGHTLVAEFTCADGSVVEGREVFSISDNLWEVGIGAADGGPFSQTAPYTEEQMVAALERERLHYSNWFEKNFWAPDDWGQLMTEPGATWYSGQARRHQNTEKLQFLIAEAHKRGIRAISYGKCMAGGVPGWERARRSPQWFSVDQYGRTMGRPADVWDLDHWNDPACKYEDYSILWTYRWVDTRVEKALDHGIDQLIGSQKQFGWDGVRFDSAAFRAHFVDGQFNGNDAYNTRNMKRLKQRIWDVLPGWSLGYNTDHTASVDGRSYPISADAPISHELREMLAGGGLFMNEAMRDFSNGSVHYTSWKQYALDEVRCIRTVKHYGGHMCYVYGNPADPAHLLYKYIIGTMMGAHDYQGTHRSAGGCGNWGRFLTRWGEFVWDARLRALKDPLTMLEVKSTRPLWWQEFVTERITAPERRYIIVNLLNPPLSDAIAETRYQLPPAVVKSQVTLQVPRGETLKRVFCIAPGNPDQVSPLPFTSEGSTVTVVVPRLDIWAMVVWELEGVFSVPAPPADMTEALTPAELADLVRLAPELAPNVPVAEEIPDPAPVHDPKIQPEKQAEASVTPPDNYVVGGGPGMDVLVIQGHYHRWYRIPEALHSAMPQARLVECTPRNLPRTHGDLSPYDVVVMINLEATLWDANGQKAMADWVAAGGRLVVLGGNFTLGQGFFSGSILEGLLPVKVRLARDVYELPMPLALSPQKVDAGASSLWLYYFHAAKPLPEARILLWAGDLPIFLEKTVDKGTCAVFLGTVLGDARTEREPPFWDGETWPKTIGPLLFGK